MEQQPLRRPWRHSLRAKLLAIVAAGILLPLLVLAAWTTRRLRTSGEDLLRQQLDATLAGVERDAEARWRTYRGELLLLADNDVVRAAIRRGPQAPQPQLASFLESAFEVARPFVDEVVFTDMAGRPLWRVAPDPFSRPRFATTSRAQVASRMGALAVTIPVTDDSAGRTIAYMTALVRIGALVPAPPSVGPSGASFALVDTTGIPLARFGAAQPLSVSAAADTTAMIVTRRMTSLPLELAARAPVEPFVEPFQRDARRAAMWSIAILALALGLALLLVTRATDSLRRLVAGADAVAQGNLDTRVPVSSSDEVGRLSEAFNTMTQELHRTLLESEHRSALAAVGEFAAELAHEVRNPLTSIRLDLQRVRERLPADDRMREPLNRALSAVDRLNRTVTGALNVARSGSVSLKPVQLDTAILPALQASETAFASRRIEWHDHLGDARRTWIRADVDALTQLFTNILFNAAEAIDRDGSVDIVGAKANGHVAVRIIDTGPGMSPETMRAVQGGFRTTKRGGTGIGLTVARRIATAHGGQLDIESALGAGTTVTLTLPTIPAEPA